MKRLCIRDRFECDIMEQIDECRTFEDWLELSYYGLYPDGLYHG